MPAIPSTAPRVSRTFSGLLIDPFQPAASAIEVRDIAHALAQQCRFGGHTRVFFSVAQHSVAVSRLAGAIDPAAAIWGLLHDGSEAYLGDVPTPLKVSPVYAAYREAEAALQAAIYHRFDCHGPVPDAVLRADEDQLAIEFRDLMPERPGDRWAVEAWGAPTLKPMSPIEAEAAFLSRFLEVYRGRWA